MSIFGWSYPPGAANDPNAPYNQVEGPCEVCGQAVDDCICPECPTCGSVGDPRCYDKHGMCRSPEQVAAHDAAMKEAAEACASEAEYWARRMTEEQNEE